MADKFLKNTIYVILGIALISFLLLQPYNIYCKINKSCNPILVSSLFQKSGLKKIKINFSSGIDKELGGVLAFKPAKEAVTIANGKQIINFYLAKNLTNKDLTISAHFSIEPVEANKYLERIECICFQNQYLKAGSKEKMMVNFRINPEIENDESLKGLREIKINYEAFVVDDY